MGNDGSPETQHAKKVKYGLLCNVVPFLKLISYFTYFIPVSFIKMWLKQIGYGMEKFLRTQGPDSRIWPNF